MVSDLCDGDDFTLDVFRKNFRSLSAWAVGQAHDELRRRRKNTKRGPLESEARYVFAALQRQKERAA